MSARSTPAEHGKRRHIQSIPRSNTAHNPTCVQSVGIEHNAYFLWSSDRRSCKHTLTTVLTTQRLTSMRKRKEFSNEELMLAMGTGKPSSKFRTKVAGGNSFRNNGSHFDEPESMEQPAPRSERNADSRKCLPPLRADTGAGRPAQDKRQTTQAFAGGVPQHLHAAFTGFEDRKPVFISRKLRDTLDRFACKIGERRMSLSGLLRISSVTTSNFFMPGISSIGKACVDPNPFIKKAFRRDFLFRGSQIRSFHFWG